MYKAHPYFGENCFVAENPRGEEPSFNIEVQLKALICACKLVTNNSNNVVFRKL